MADTPYAHLHVHTEYSMLDGAARLKDMFKEVKANGMTHVAMTDHGNMYGAAEFHRQAKDAGITPVIGIEAYVAPEHRGNKNRVLWGQPHQKRDDVSASGAYLHKTIWAREQRGPAQPVQAHRRSYAEGWLAKWARMDKEIIAEHAAGLMASTGCPSGERADPAAPRPGGRGAQGRRRVPGHLRQGELLPRADGPRPGHRDPGPRRPHRDRQEAEHPAGRHQRLPLQQGERLRVARPAAVHPDRQDPGGRRPVQVRRLRLLHQVARRDVRGQQQRHLAGGLPQLPAADRRPGRHGRHVRVRQPDAALPDPGGVRVRGRAVRRTPSGRAWPSATRTASTTPAASRPSTRSASSPRWASPPTSWSSRTSSTGRRTTASRSAPAAAARRAASSPTRWASPTSTRSTTA